MKKCQHPEELREVHRLTGKSFCLGCGTPLLVLPTTPWHGREVKSNG